VLNLHFYFSKVLLFKKSTASVTAWGPRKQRLWLAWMEIRTKGKKKTKVPSPRGFFCSEGTKPLRRFSRSFLCKRRLLSNPDGALFTRRQIDYSAASLLSLSLDPPSSSRVADRGEPGHETKLHVGRARI
jgi:hypothetical protein